MMNQKMLCILTLIFALLLVGCGTQPAELPTATVAPTETPAAVTASASGMLESEQRALIEQNRALWAFTESWDSPWFYTVTDLDRNGRLEVIAATTQGSGMFTYGHFYELTEDFSALRSCRPENAEVEGTDDWPEIVMERMPCYHDPATGRCYYVVEGITRSGLHCQYYAWYALLLENGVADFEFLASMETDYDEYADRPIVTCRDAQGNPISEQDYQSAAERRFAGMERTEQYFDWTRVENPLPEEPASFLTESAAVVITKQPRSETLAAGGRTWFIAHADNALSLSWEVVDPNGAVYSLDQAMALHPGLSLEVLPEDTLGVGNVPASFSGWGVYALFQGADSYALSDVACVYVQAPVTLEAVNANPYDGIIAAYRTLYESGNSQNRQYIYDNALSEITMYSTGAAYALLDLDGNAVQELLIFGRGTDDFSDRILYDCYTLQSGSPVQLGCSRERMRWYLLADGSLFWEGSGGAAYFSAAALRVNGAGLTQTEGLYTDQNTDGGILYYSVAGEGEPYAGSVNGIPIDEQAFWYRVDALRNTIVVPDLTPIV